MIVPPRISCGLAHFVLLVEQLLLSCNEHILIVIYDRQTSHITSEILRQNIGQTRIVFNIEFERTKILQNIQKYYNESSVIIAPLSDSVASVYHFFTVTFSKEIFNAESKVLYVIPENRPIFDDGTFIEFIGNFANYSIHFSVVQLNDIDFKVQSYVLPYVHNGDDIVIKTNTKEEFYTDAPVNVRKLMYPIRLRGLTVSYLASTFNPPFVYRVADFNAGASEHLSFIGGSDIRMVELLMERFNWTMNYFLPNYDEFLIGDLAAEECQECEFNRQFNDRVFRTDMSDQKRHHTVIESSEDIIKKYIPI